MGSLLPSAAAGGLHQMLLREAAIWDRFCRITPRYNFEPAYDEVQPDQALIESTLRDCAFIPPGEAAGDALSSSHMPQSSAPKGTMMAGGAEYRLLSRLTSREKAIVSRIQRVARERFTTRNAAAVKIQQRWKMFAATRYVEKSLRRPHRAAVCIQSRVRGMQLRTQLRATRLLQRWWRGTWARRRVMLLRHLHRCSRIIQATYRGFASRCRHRRLLFSSMGHTSFSFV